MGAFVMIYDAVVELNAAMDMVLHAKQSLIWFSAYTGQNNCFTVVIEFRKEHGSELSKLGTGPLGLHSKLLEAR